MIKIKNFYYMLSYAFTVLNQKGYRQISKENFNHIGDLYASILIKGVSNQLKRGLHQEFKERNETISVLRGKVNISDSIRSLSFLDKKLNCTYDALTENIYFNEILKTTLLVLVKLDITKERQKKIKKLLIHFNQVDCLNPQNINWNFRYSRSNQTYQMLMGICELVIKSSLHSFKDKQQKIMDFEDEQQMAKLYEKFILEYYKKTFPQIKVNSSHIPWYTDDGMTSMLPTMKSDIMLSYKDKYLIIDAKYYTKTIQNYYDTPKVHSANMYQIFTYVKNYQMSVANPSSQVTGMLLYAKTDEKILPNATFLLGGNAISVKTLDLNCEFEDIEKELKKHVFEYFDIE
ncbi:5-methylcytosine-specific restriction endonuclease system specificity protein McrC [Staphylococcus chromogenes]|uniref:5-methylcytosine-specific restriction endonuclease system specificity protein McrC n=1 Tax=Staphylococcus chromogenes TaxID=46126 RepID=UPI00118B5674|nr:5-methylcytosine-specific restriction endonuclease system specificity protein McrC [Staphylococcus chromogenes]QDW90585.1 5-methylcytosine-specific restriction endonuclease system specificity protein McrC [Staphylococcus chromogenes]